MRQVMSRRNALATVASIAAANTVATTSPMRRDPVLELAARSKAALEEMERLGDYKHVKIPPEADERFYARMEIVNQMIGTPAETLAGVLAKLEEAFEEELAMEAAPDLAIWTIQNAYDDIKRIAGIA